MSMIPDKITLPKGTKAKLAAARTIPAVTMPFEVFDFTAKNLRWIDDPNGKTLTASGILGHQIVIMGGAAKTPYNVAWQEQDARNALWAQLELPPATVTPTATQAAPAPNPAPTVPKAS